MDIMRWLPSLSISVEKLLDRLSNPSWLEERRDFVDEGALGSALKLDGMLELGFKPTKLELGELVGVGGGDFRRRR